MGSTPTVANEKNAVKRTPPKKLQSCEHLPSAPVNKRPASNIKGPWYERPLADHWSAEERLFLGNWRREVVRLYDTFVSAAEGRHKLLWRASFDLFRLARYLRCLAKAAEEKAAKEAAEAVSDV